MFDNTNICSNQITSQLVNRPLRKVWRSFNLVVGCLDIGPDLSQRFFYAPRKVRPPGARAKNPG